MDEEDIIEEINRLKIRLKEIILEINGLKGQLEQSKISLDEFRGKKGLLETELRGIIQQIAKIKEETGDLAKPIVAKKEKQQEIKKEIAIAEEIQDLMQNFQIELDSSISKAKITLSLSEDEIIELNVDFANYPERPIIFLPPSIIRLFKSLEREFYQKISSYNNWDSTNPKRIYELIEEIERVLKDKTKAE